MKKIKRAQPFDQKSKIQPFITKDISPDLQPPKFSLQYLNKDYCISLCQKDEKVSFVNQIHLLSQQTWAQLRQAPRHGLGFEKIDKGKIRPSIPSHITDDVNIIAFRFHGKAPMVGYHSADGTFYIIWFDRNFKLYDHGS